MKNKNLQMYSNDCGINAIKNLLAVNKIKHDNLILDFDKNGTSMYEMVRCLKKYFYEVNAITFDIREIKNVKKFVPFISLINSEFPHYVVVYKKNKRFLYVLDSLFKRSYKITYENASKLFTNKAIITEQTKHINNVKNLVKESIFIPILSIIESIFLLSSTVIIQQIIDNGFKDALLYIIVHIAVLLITTIKMKLFLLFFKRIDRKLIFKITKGVFHLNDSYLKNYSIDEIYYRTFDAYAYKQMILSFVFNIVNDFCLSILAIVLMFHYSINLSILVLFLLFIISSVSFYIFKKNMVLLENKRKSEYTFINNYKSAIHDLDNNTKRYETLKSLQKMQEDDFKLEKLNMNKNLILLYFQSIVVSLMCVLYFTSLYKYITVGSLVALINLITITLQPVLNICCEISIFSNRNLILKRLKDLDSNIN